MGAGREQAAEPRHQTARCAFLSLRCRLTNLYTAARHSTRARRSTKATRATSVRPSVNCFLIEIKRARHLRRRRCSGACATPAAAVRRSRSGAPGAAKRPRRPTTVALLGRPWPRGRDTHRPGKARRRRVHAARHARAQDTGGLRRLRVERAPGVRAHVSGVDAKGGDGRQDTGYRKAHRSSTETRPAHTAQGQQRSPPPFPATMSFTAPELA
jgi:hypothetical protein